VNEETITGKCSVTFSSAISNLQEVNQSFDRGVMKVAYHGQNRNQMFIGKKQFVEAIPSIYNCPIVCNYKRESDSIGAHDVEIVKQDNAVKMVNVTTPVGVVPESANVWWKEVVEDNGETHEYLCCDILLWKRQEAYAHLKENGITDESMEIRILSGGRKEDGLYHVGSFEFLAFCLLESAPPCFESAGIELFTLDAFETEYANMMEDFKREFSTVMTASADDINLLKGGTEKLDLSELMEKYGLSAEEIDFDTNGMELSDIESRFAQIQESKQEKPVVPFSADEQEEESSEGGNQEPDEEDVPQEPFGEEPETEQPEEDEPEQQGFSLTAEQFLSELLEAMRAETFTDPIWGEMCKYWYMDHDFESNEVYAYDVSDDKMYGFTYTRNGDHVVIDFASKKRKKTAFVDFDEGDSAFSIREMISDFRTKFEKRYADEAEVFGKFTDLNGNEMFEQLRKECADMTIGQIEEKCFAIRGRNVSAAHFSLEGQARATRIPIERQNEGNTDEPYGGIFVKYRMGK